MNTQSLHLPDGEEKAYAHRSMNIRFRILGIPKRFGAGIISRCYDTRDEASEALNEARKREPWFVYRIIRQRVD